MAQPHITCADLRTLYVHHDRNFATDFSRNLPDALANFAGPLVAGVGHIDTADVYAAQDQLFESLFTHGRRTDGEDDLLSGEYAVSYSVVVCPF